MTSTIVNRVLMKGPHMRSFIILKLARDEKWYHVHMPKLLDSDPMEVGLNGNYLSLNNRAMRTNVLRHSPEKIAVSAQQLDRILAVGRMAILNGIVNFRFPGATTTPSIWTLHLGTNKQVDPRDSKLFTERGWKNGGVNERLDEIQAPFDPYWGAMKNNGFRPEVRRTFGKGDGGAWMLLRKPTLMQVSLEWYAYSEPPELASLGYFTPEVTDELKNIYHPGVSLPLSTKHDILQTVADLQDSYADELDDKAKKMDVSPDLRAEFRSNQQIGALIARVALKRSLDYERDAAEEDLEDVYTYAVNNSRDKVGVSPGVLALENAMF